MSPAAVDPAAGGDHVSVPDCFQQGKVASSSSSNN
jgi:hypothetical protein